MFAVKKETERGRENVAGMMVCAFVFEAEKNGARLCEMQAVKTGSAYQCAFNIIYVIL